ncbi:MAG: LemA family protein [Planctomycetaceae bacterium]|jgi:LemA protein|nr:LemA family protein [Planctomycetaceae bacterium]
MKQRSESFTSSSRRGAIGKGCLIGLGVVGALVLVAVMLLWSGYNSLVGTQEDSRQKWAQVENQYKRRFELVPNLVETVKGAANFEQQTITQVTEARASVGSVKMPSDLPTDQAQLDAYIKAQAQLGGALSRLMVVAEQYPQLKATENFRTLQDQLEGTENRIAVAREDYTKAVATYNKSVRSFPKNVLAGMFGFETLPQFTAPAEEQVVPKVDFGTK